MQKYITILEVGNEDCPNAGTITMDNAEKKFKEVVVPIKGLEKDEE